MTTALHKDMVSPRVLDRLRHGQLTEQQVEEFRDFLEQVDRELFHHRIITDNAYTRWFRAGQATDPELVHFIRQFSVFSNQFLVAALLRVINAPDAPAGAIGQGDSAERAGGDLPADERGKPRPPRRPTTSRRIARGTPIW